MKTSQELKNIYSAIIKARPEIAPIARTKSARNYKYATLDSVIELLSLVLPKHGLGWLQTLSTEDGQPILVTRMIHESGEWIEDAMVLPQTKLNGGANESQELGASITYFKRYALSAIFGIATDDDTDGVAEVRERKQQVKANARAARETEMQDAPTEATATACNLIELVQSTGDAAIDKAILERVTQKYKGQQLFTQKTVAWLNNIIHEKTPQEALASANMAVNKMINKLDNETAA
jgi:hypothetical protein